jgi:hypothetical protein
MSAGLSEKQPLREADRQLAPAGQSTCTRQRALKLARDHNKTYWIVDFEQILALVWMRPTANLRTW